MQDMFNDFGIKVTSVPWEDTANLPYIFIETYDFNKITLDGIPCIFATPKSEIPAIQAITKHFSRISSYAGLPVVLRMNGLSGERRKALVEARIPFVATGQTYLPFMGISLQERIYSEPKPREKLMPSSQLLLFAYLYQESRKMFTSKMADRLEISPMQITRAVRQLHRLNLFEVGKEGVNVVLIGKESHHNLYEKAKPYLIDPIREIIYITQNEQINILPLSGLSALSEMSMLSAPMVATRAFFSRVKKIQGECTLIDRERQVRVEVWKYPPTALSASQDIADPLSVIASLMDEKDERIDQAIEEALKKIWR